MGGACRWLGVVVLVTIAVLAGRGCGQQPYVNNKQSDCDNPEYDSLTKGFVCNGAQSSCQAYLTFRAQPPYTAPNTIGYLLGGAQDSAALIASLNNISSDVASIPTNTQVVVPVDCSCFNTTYYQHNASYILKYRSETYFTVANNTYQGLSTCQAMMSQNPYGERNLSVGMDLRVPLRCACPTSNQSRLGVKYLLSYMVTWGDDVTSIANTFGVDKQAVLDANELSSTSIIFPFTPILVPLTSRPTKIQLSAPSAPSPQTPTVPVSSPNSSSNDNKWVYIGVGIGVAVLLILLLLLFGYCYYHRKSRKSPAAVPFPNKLGNESSSADYGAIPISSDNLSLSSHGLKYAIESLTVYRFDDLLLATGNFGEDRRIKGTSVYRGNFKGDEAAVKVMKGDVSAEIKILQMINHSNIIRLSGFCVYQGNTYLVYEYADNGSLYDCLHEHKDKVGTDQHLLSWKQRVQIAYDVADALNYLHNYTNPPYIHKNLKTTNILLDSNFRAKVSNFGLARTLQDQNSGMQLQLTRHVVGTQGYMAPEYIENGVITTKMDVFAFGVVLLELLSGREAVSFGPDKNAGGDDLLSASIIRVLEGDNVRQKLHDFIDPLLRDEYPLDLAFSMAELAKSCVAHDLNARPSISEAFMTMSKIISSSLDWDPSSELRHSRSLSHGR